MKPFSDDRMKALCGRVSLPIPTSNIEHAAKRIIQSIAYDVALGSLFPCPSCQKNDVSIGQERYMDAAGSSDTRDCTRCGGWTVIR